MKKIFFKKFILVALLPVFSFMAYQNCSKGFNTTVGSSSPASVWMFSQISRGSNDPGCPSGTTVKSLTCEKFCPDGSSKGQRYIDGKLINNVPEGQHTDQRNISTINTAATHFDPTKNRYGFNCIDGQLIWDQIPGNCEFHVDQPGDTECDGTPSTTTNGGVVSGGDSEGSVDINYPRICNDDISNPSDTICNGLSDNWINTTINLQNATRGVPKLYMFVNGIFILANGHPVALTSGTVPIQWGSNNATSCTLRGVSVPTSGAKTLTDVGDSWNSWPLLKCTNSTDYATLGATVSIPNPPPIPPTTSAPTISSMSVTAESIIVNGTNLGGVTSLSYTPPSPNVKIYSPVTHTLTYMLSQSSTRLVFPYGQMVETDLKNSQTPWSVILHSPKGNSSVFIWESRQEIFQCNVSYNMYKNIVIQQIVELIKFVRCGIL